MAISLKNYAKRLNGDLRTIDFELSRSNYDKVIGLCDEWLEGDRLQIKPISDITFMHFTASFLYYRARALLGKVYLLSASSSEAFDGLTKELDETVKKFLFFYDYSSEKFRRMMQSACEILIAETAYITMEDCTFDDWLEVCLSALERQSEKKGRQNSLICAELTMNVVQSCLAKGGARIKDVRELMEELLDAARAITEQYDEFFEESALKVQLDVMSMSLKGEADPKQIAQSFSILDHFLETDEVDGMERDRLGLLKNYACVIEKLGSNDMEGASDHAHRAVACGLSYLEQLGDKNVDLPSLRVMQILTTIYCILYRIENDDEYLSTSIDLWRTLLPESGTASGEVSYPEAVAQLTAHTSFFSCYICRGDIQSALQSKAEIEEFLEDHRDFFDDEASCFCCYEIYKALHLYYRSKQQMKDAEVYRKRSEIIEEALRESSYADKVAETSRLLDSLLK